MVTYANGVVYKGNFTKGEFHGEGTLIYPNGVIKNFVSCILGPICCKMGPRKID